ncbi:conserved exported protein of unknown function (plasmid) [Ralstonia solanacearum Po82]|uniref:DUF2968 domain-containing protein n=2 Tax=Ralstonia solanacearum TaxID=305 RepID=F6G936_RALS8|nr:conserved exported protein of unknown function [Ralstonia solanacearum Po82]
MATVTATVMPTATSTTARSAAASSPRWMPTTGAGRTPRPRWASAAKCCGRKCASTRSPTARPNCASWSDAKQHPTPRGAGRTCHGAAGSRIVFGCIEQNQNHRVDMRTTTQRGIAVHRVFKRGLAIAAAVAAVTGGTACTSAVAQSPAVPPTAINPVASAAPVPALTATVGQANAAPATAPSAPSAPDSAARAEAQAADSAVLELQRRMQARELAELRTTYNGAYGASLLFAQSDLTYYVTLFQQKDLWRVIKTTNEAHAERIYADFSRQTRSLSDLDLQRIRLEAQKERAERQVAEQESRLRGLRADLDLQRQQQAQVQARQKVARTETDTLDAERRAARARLDELQRQIRSLEAQVNAPFGGARSH